mmetsp:Transcript_37655/g.120038  ORF Transcript_37655/g.120038 Transcript_37655/m.120038 type:complete len:183 (-) Transcript_37655:124-672(-)
MFKTRQIGDRPKQFRVLLGHLGECSRLAREEERRQRLEEKERLRQEKADEAASRDAREHARWEREEVAAFLKVHGFAHVQAKQKKWLRSFYPLHVAVEENNAEALSYLLRAGADKSQKDSSGRTAVMLAQKRDKKGSHEQVVPQQCMDSVFPSAPTGEDRDDCMGGACVVGAPKDPDEPIGK